MGNKSVQASRTNHRGDKITVQAHETDSPILPAAQLERLHHFRPDLVDFVVEETRREAEFRREQTKRLHRYVFIERMFGQLLALIVTTIGIGGGLYAGFNGQPWLGGVIATASISTLAVAYIRSLNAEKSSN